MEFDNAKEELSMMKKYGRRTKGEILKNSQRNNEN